MATSHDVDRYKAFLNELALEGYMIIVREVSGVKYFQWVSLRQLKIELGL